MKFPFSRFIVHGQSMSPILQPNQQVVTFNWFYYPLIGDLIVFQKDHKEMVKRIKKIKNNSYFVEGDNPQESTDSRDFGWIDRAQIIGKVIWYQT